MSEEGPGSVALVWRTLEDAKADALACTKCRLAGGRTTVVWMDGSPTADLLFVGEAPGFHEDRQGRPFVGAAGQLLDTMLATIGLDRSMVAIANVLKCRPPGNRDPMADEIEACRPYLDAQIRFLAPTVIVTLGNFATRFVLARQVSISRVRGQRFSKHGATVIPTFHPAAVLHGGGQTSPQMRALRSDFALVRSVLDEPRRPAPPAAAARAAVEQTRRAVRVDGADRVDPVDRVHVERVHHVERVEVVERAEVVERVERVEQQSLF